MWSIPRIQLAPQASTQPRPAAGRPPATLLLTALCAVVLGACADITAPESAAPTDPASGVTPSALKPAATDITFGDFAVHIPANVHRVRGVLIALGGPNTRGFANGSAFGAPMPTLEASLQELGAMLRDLAAERGLAIIGSARFGPFAYPNTPASDQQLLGAISQAAALTGHPEMTQAPVVLYAISGGGPEAAGFTQRNPDRVGALLLVVPALTGPLSGDALKVPALMILAEQDIWVNNAALGGFFATHRAAGAPWAMAVEPGVVHHSLSPAKRDLIVNWMRAILPLGNATPFRGTSPNVGFLADPVTGRIAPPAAYSGDRAAASWLPARPLATQWARFIGH